MSNIGALHDPPEWKGTPKPPPPPMRIAPRVFLKSREETAVVVTASTRTVSVTTIEKPSSETTPPPACSKPPAYSKVRLRGIRKRVEINDRIGVVLPACLADPKATEPDTIQVRIDTNMKAQDMIVLSSQTELLEQASLTFGERVFLSKLVSLIQKEEEEREKQHTLRTSSPVLNETIRAKAAPMGPAGAKEKITPKEIMLNAAPKTSTVGPPPTRAAPPAPSSDPSSASSPNSSSTLKLQPDSRFSKRQKID